MNTPIPFDVEVLNIGGAMNLTSGIFTTPRAGTYSFSFIGYAHIPGSSSKLALAVRMYLNGNLIGSGLADDIGTVLQSETLSLQSTLNLQNGDQISLQISYMDSGTYLHDSSNHYNHFSGWLLEENISQGLNSI